MDPRSPAPPIGKNPAKGKGAAPAAGAAGAAAGGAGSSSSKSGAELSLDELKTRGQTEIDALDNAIKTKAPDRVAPGSLRDKYHVQDELMPATPDLRNLMAQSGRSADRKDAYFEYTIRVKNTEDPAKADGDIISQLKFSKDKGVFINEVSYSSRDTLGDDRMFLSDQQYAAWVDKSGNNRLTLMIQRNIQNDATLKAFPANGKASYGPETDGYKQIMGSDNGRPFARFLRDYHGALGDKKVTRIDVYGGSRNSILFIVG